MEQITVLAPSSSGQYSGAEVVSKIVEQAPLKPMDQKSLDFLKALSNTLLKNQLYNKHSELVALGFWLRQKHLLSVFEELKVQHNNEQSASTSWLKPVGTVVHFTPNNVDTMFVYSWVCSLLCGNNNVIRVSSGESELRTSLMAAIDKLLANPLHHDIAQRNGFVSYPKTSHFSALLSSLADARVIWGGDDSVNTIRALACKPRCRDISFADRYSATLIDTSLSADDSDLNNLAQSLWKDTEPYQQQACSSPRVIYFKGQQKTLRSLLDKLNTLAIKQLESITRANNLLINLQLIKSRYPTADVLVQDAICAVSVPPIDQACLDWHGGKGMFYIRQIDTVADMLNEQDQKLQTLSYWGVEKLALLKLLTSTSISGIDRLVPIGQALDFSPNWDGYQLQTQLTRQVTIL